MGVLAAVVLRTELRLPDAVYKAISMYLLLAIGLKGGSEKLRERLFSNMSEEAGNRIKEEMEYSGPVRLSDVEKVQLAIVKTVRQLEEQGEVKIVRGEPDRFV